ncbi:MAG: hypothetical protein ACKVPY_15345 [Paracoccaceae bacterium]
MKRLLITTAAALVAATMAFADAATDAIVANLQGQGFTAIEIKVGPTQIKAEAANGGVVREIIYDRATGAILKDETESGSISIAAGVEISFGDRDFLRGRRNGTDDSFDDNGHHAGFDDSGHHGGGGSGNSGSGSGGSGSGGSGNSGSGSGG